MCTMSLTLGQDIGLVMAKGVLLGVICTVTILPAFIMTFRGIIEKYSHRTHSEISQTSRFVVKHYIPILAVFFALFIPFSIAQPRQRYTTHYLTVCRRIWKVLWGQFD